MDVSRCQLESFTLVVDGRLSHAGLLADIPTRDSPAL